jgi:hypothetical protein
MLATTGYLSSIRGKWFVLAGERANASRIATRRSEVAFCTLTLTLTRALQGWGSQAAGNTEILFDRFVSEG